MLNEASKNINLDKTLTNNVHIVGIDTMNPNHVNIFIIRHHKPLVHIGYFYQFWVNSVQCLSTRVTSKQTPYSSVIITSERKSQFFLSTCFDSLNKDLPCFITSRVRYNVRLNVKIYIGPCVTTAPTRKYLM